MRVAMSDTGHVGLDVVDPCDAYTSGETVRGYTCAGVGRWS
jgi:hypothetical protein